MKDALRDQVESCVAELEEIEKKIESLPPLDKMKSYLTMYALMRTCGTIEFVYRAIVADFFDQFPIPQLHSYMSNTVREASASATYDNMCNLLKKFDSSWTTDFKNLVGINSNKDKMLLSTHSLVQNRHQFAHGMMPTVTFNDIKLYYHDSLQLLAIFDSIVK